MRRSLAMAGIFAALLLGNQTASAAKYCTKDADCGAAICQNNACVTPPSCVDTDGTAVDSFLVKLYQSNFADTDLYSLVYETLDSAAEEMIDLYKKDLINLGYLVPGYEAGDITIMSEIMFKAKSKAALEAVLKQITTPGQTTAYISKAEGSLEQLSSLDACKTDEIVEENLCVSKVGLSWLELFPMGWKCPAVISNNQKVQTSCRTGTHPVTGVTAGFCAMADEYPVKDPAPPSKPPDTVKTCTFPCIPDPNFCDKCPGTLECEQPGEVCKSGEDLCPDIAGMQTEADGWGPGKKDCHEVDETACLDPDSVKWFATVVCESGNTQCHIDFCKDIDTVTHYQCEAGKLVFTYDTDCLPPGTTCKKGLCSGQPPPEKIKCDDTDKGVNTPTDVDQGVSGNGQNGFFSKKDKCADEKTSQEWSCDLFDPKGYKSDPKACPAQTVCCSDHCDVPPAINCKETDPTNDVHIKGVFTGVPFSDDVCLFGETNVVIQSNCDPFNSCSGVIKTKSYCPVGELCQDGVCVPEPADSPVCNNLSDTDYGDLPDVGGIVTGELTSLGVSLPFSEMDQCVGATSVKNVNVAEVPPCFSYGRTMACQPGEVCEPLDLSAPGKCVPAPTCTDTDIPDDPLKGGVVQAGALAPHPDHCNPLLPDWLIQMGCVDGQLQLTQQTDCATYFEGFEGSCVDDAVNGAICVKGVPKPPPDEPPPDRGENPPPDRLPPVEPSPSLVCTQISDNDAANDPTIGGILQITKNLDGIEVTYEATDQCNGIWNVNETQLVGEEEGFPECHYWFMVPCPAGTECIQPAGKAGACVKSLPKPPPPLACNESDYVVKDIEAGSTHSCAIVDTPDKKGTVWCWGGNLYGQVTDVTKQNPIKQPVQVVGVAGATALGAGTWSSCAIIGGEEFICWGDNQNGQMINGKPASVGWLGANKVASGQKLSCALGKDGKVWCIGPKSGIASVGGEMLPLLDSVGDGVVGVDIDTNNDANPALCVAKGAGLNGGVKCLGSPFTSAAILGNPVKDPYGNIPDPKDYGGVPISELPADQVSLENSKGYARSADMHEVWSWGGSFTTLQGKYSVKYFATKLDYSGETAQIASGSSHTCLRKKSGDVLCMGESYKFPLEPGFFFLGSAMAKPTFGGVINAADIAAGESHSCVLFDDGSVKCWGSNYSGQLGIDPKLIPKDPYGNPVKNPNLPIQFCPSVLAPKDPYGVPIL